MKNVLLIDDDPNFLVVHGEALSRAGYHVIPKLDAESALSVLGDVTVDLVITEYQMPVLSSLSLLSVLRELMPKVPLIVIARHCSADIYLKVMNLGTFAYMNKPVRADELTRVVKAALPDTESDGLSRT